MIVDLCKKSLENYLTILNKLSNEEYKNKIERLNLSAIGAHTRHILEFYSCLINSYEKGTVNYDTRERNLSIECEIEVAKKFLKTIKNTLDKENKKLVLLREFDNEILSFSTDYHRELLHNLEHTIHHEAIIKIMLTELKIDVKPDFGIASSTLDYQKKCAQ